MQTLISNHSQLRRQIPLIHIYRLALGAIFRISIIIIDASLLVSTSLTLTANGLNQLHAGSVKPPTTVTMTATSASTGRPRSHLRFKP